MSSGHRNSIYDLRHKRIYVAGHTGLAGSAMVRALRGEECTILTVPHADLDLRDQTATAHWVKMAKPDVVVVAAATVGGIGANIRRPANFLYDNLMIEANLIDAAYRAGVGKLLFLGSSCIYPRDTAQPILESALLSGPLEPSNEFYAIAKIAGIKLCQAYRRQYGCDFISAMPCNLYGPGDRFDLEDSHVIPALMMKMHMAKTEGRADITLWGTGVPLREFLHADDLALGLLTLLKNYSGESAINIGGGSEISIADLATVMAEVTGFKGRIIFDPAHPDGTPRKVMDSGAIKAMGWAPAMPLRDGLRQTYEWYKEYDATRAKAA